MKWIEIIGFVYLFKKSIYKKTDEMKICGKCKIEKLVTHFHEKSKSKDGLFIKDIKQMLFFV